MPKKIWLISLIFVLACSRSPQTSVPSSNGFQTPQRAATPGKSDISTTAAPFSIRKGGSETDFQLASPAAPQDLLKSLGILVPEITDADLVNVPARFSGRIDLPAIRKAIFEQINRDRAANGLPALDYDPVAEKAGNLQNFREVKADHMLGHFSLNGDKPYMRYSEVGGYDGERENWASGAINLGSYETIIESDPYAKSGSCPKSEFKPLEPGNIQDSLVKLALGMECDMLNELPGHDGHRKAILSAHTTSVGIGIGVAVRPGKGSQPPSLRLFMTEEFTNRILQSHSEMPLAIRLSQTPRLGFWAEAPEGYSFDEMTFFYEQRKPLTADQASAITHYSFPDVLSLFVPALPAGEQYTPATLRQYPNLQDTVVVQGREFAIPLTFSHGPGVYTLVVWLKQNSSGTSQIVTSRSIFAAD